MKLKKKIIKKKYKIAFLDRDGVLNKNLNGGYIGEIKNFRWISGAKKTIQFLNKQQYKVIVVTNQSGIARGYFKKKDVFILHKFMKNELSKIGAKIDKFCICPHHIDGKIKEFKKKCSCRKPGNKHFRDINKLWRVDKKKSFMIGDQITDIEFANKSGIKCYYFNKKNLFHFMKEKITDGV